MLLRIRCNKLSIVSDYSNNRGANPLQGYFVYRLLFSSFNVSSSSKSPPPPRNTGNNAAHPSITSLTTSPLCDILHLIRIIYISKSSHATGFPNPTSYFLIVRKIQDCGRHTKGVRLTRSGTIHSCLEIVHISFSAPSAGDTCGHGRGSLNGLREPFHFALGCDKTFCTMCDENFSLKGSVGAFLVVALLHLCTMLDVKSSSQTPIWIALNFIVRFNTF